MASHRTTFVIKPVRDEPAPDDGRRILVDRLWPRGVSRERAALDDWWKDIAPTPELRVWFNHQEAGSPNRSAIPPHTAQTRRCA